MAVQALAAIAVVAIAFYQSVRGLFSALVMMILTLVCTLLAFGFYEPLAESFLYARQPATADAIMLVALFFIPLLVLRLIFDRILPREITLGVWPDRILGGIFGLVTGILAVGVLIVALQMLPFGKTILTFRPFDDGLRRRQSLAPFYPDQFTVRLAGIVSGGSLSGSERFARAHDNLLLELFCARNRAGKNGRIDATPDSLKVHGAYDLTEEKRKEIEGLDRLPPAPLLPAEANIRPVVVRIGVNEQLRGAKDWWRLVGTHFRLVGPDGQSHYPVGYLTYVSEERAENTGRLYAGWRFFPPLKKENQWQYADLLVGRPWSPKIGIKELKVDWVYQLPVGKDEGYYMVFRRVAKAPVGKIAKDIPLDELQEKALYRDPPILSKKR